MFVRNNNIVTTGMKFRQIEKILHDKNKIEGLMQISEFSGIIY